MILSQRSIEILKNFTQICPDGMVFPQGNKLAVTPPKIQTIFANAELDEPFEERFVIFDVVQMMACITSFASPQLTVLGKKVIITDAQDRKAGKFSILTGSETLFKEPPVFTYPSETTVISFELPRDSHNRLLKGIGIVQSEEIAIEGKDGEIRLAGFSRHNNSSSQYSVPIGETTEQFKFVLSTDNMSKVMRNQDYIVSVSGRGVAHFQADRLAYSIACESI